MMIKYLLLFIGVAAGFEDKTIVQYLVDNGFTTLVGAVQNAGLDTVLSSKGPFTVFAPTDAAFAKLGSTLSTLTPSQLEMILKYHVVDGFLLGPQIQSEKAVTTLNGQSMTLRTNSPGLKINNVSLVTQSDIILNNGVVHVIDTVLIPPVMPTLSIPQLLLQDDTRFTDLFLALVLAGLTTDLESNGITLFAPVNSAFEVYKNNLLSQNAPNASAIYREVLKYHVVPGVYMANQLQNGMTLPTLHGTNVTVKIGTGVMVNTANVIDADLLATNGVIHVIDTLLVPSDLRPTGTGRR